MNEAGHGTTDTKPNSSWIRRLLVAAIASLLVVVGFGLSAGPASAGGGSGTAACNARVMLRDGPSRDSVGRAIFWNEYYFQFCGNGREITSTYISQSNWRLTNIACCSNPYIASTRFEAAPYFVSWNGRARGAVRFRVGATVRGSFGGPEKYIWRDVTVRANGSYSWTGWGG